MLTSTSNTPRQPLFFGATCGPHAGLYFPPAALGTSPAWLREKGGAASALFAALDASNNNQHGFISLPYADGGVAPLAEALRKHVAQKRALASQLRGDCSAHDAIVHRTQRQLDAALLEHGFFTEYCHEVAATMDRLGVTWSAVAVAQSFGALVAAKMALLYPERVGSLFLLPGEPAASSSNLSASTSCAHLITKDAVSFAASLTELRKAATDVNIPQELFDFSLQELQQSERGGGSAKKAGGDDEEADAEGLTPLSKSLSCDAADRTLIQAALGERAAEGAAPAAEGGAASFYLAEADVNAWMTVDQLRLVQHPMCLVTSPACSADDITAAEAFFNVRRVAKVKAASAPAAAAKNKDGAAAAAGDKDKKDAAAGAAETVVKSVLHAECVKETADHLANWAKRYDGDELVRRKWQQAKQEMDKLLSVGGAGGEGGSDAAAAGGGGDKDGKKKKKDKGKKPEK